MQVFSAFILLFDKYYLTLQPINHIKAAITPTQMRYFFLLTHLFFTVFMVRAASSFNSAEADSLLQKGLRYSDEYRYLDALEVLTQAVEKAEETGNDDAYLQSLLSIANIHRIFDDQEQAIHYFSQCYDKAKDMDNRSIMTQAGFNKLICLCTIGDEISAQKWYAQVGSINTGDPLKDRFFSYLQQGQLAKAKKDYHAAIYYFNEALQFAESREMGSHYSVPQMGQIGTMEELLGNDNKAIEWYLKCLDYAQKDGLIPPLVSSYEHLSSIYRKLHNDSASMRYQRLYVQLTDSLFSEREFKDKRSRIADYETRTNLLKIDTLNDRNRSLLWIIGIIAFMLISLIFLIIYIVRQNRHLVDTQRLLIDKHNELNHQLEMQSRMSEEYFNKIGKSSAIQETNSAIDFRQTAGGLNESDTEESTDVSTPLLTKQQTDHLLMSIAQIMEDSQLISDPEFSLQRLATLVNSNTKYVSWAINATYGKNFKTYLNEYRVREASRMLADSAKYGNLTIAAISEQLGYKSPTSFNQAFKRVFGMTPAAYQKLTNQ